MIHLSLTKSHKMKKLILDPCCGSKMFWFNKNHPNVIYGDQRKENHILCDGRALEIKPDIILDAKNLPFEDESFWHVILDPPHLIIAGDKGWMKKKYGKLPAEWQAEIRLMFLEAYRVLKTNGTLIFKWNETQIKVSELIKLFGVNPLYGQMRTGKDNKTVWLAFMKISD